MKRALKGGSMNLDTILFYGGLILTAVFSFLALMTALLLKIRYLHLSAQMDEEYGKEKELNQRRGA